MRLPKVLRRCRACRLHQLSQLSLLLWCKQLGGRAGLLARGAGREVCNIEKKSFLLQCRYSDNMGRTSPALISGTATLLPHTPQGRKGERPQQQPRASGLHTLPRLPAPARGSAARRAPAAAPPLVTTPRGVTLLRRCLLPAASAAGPPPHRMHQPPSRCCRSRLPPPPPAMPNDRPCRAVGAAGRMQSPGRPRASRCPAARSRQARRWPQGWHRMQGRPAARRWA